MNKEKYSTNLTEQTQIGLGDMGKIFSQIVKSNRTKTVSQQADIIVLLHGWDKFDPSLISQIKKVLQNSLSKLGFEYSNMTETNYSAQIVFYQFGFACKK